MTQLAAERRDTVTDRRAPRRRIPLTALVGAILLGIVVVVALVSFIYLPYPPQQIGGGRLTGPSAAHWLGTDALGRDLASQLMVGARIALAAGAGATLIGAVLGVILGLVAAFTQRWIDDGLAAILDILIAFPSLLLAMLVVAARGATLTSAIIALGRARTAVVARLTLSSRYVTAARTSGTGVFGIIGRHVLPNLWPTLAVILALQFGLAVLAEASLSYLGLGAPPPNASWGSLLRDAQATVYTAPVGAIAPGVALVILVLGTNLVADGLRELFDPTRRQR